MKKKTVKKLRLSRETLQALTTSDTQKVVGQSDDGEYGSCGTGWWCCRPSTPEEIDCGTG
jgi:hypothetical protein